MGVWRQFWKQWLTPVCLGSLGLGFLLIVVGVGFAGLEWSKHRGELHAKATVTQVEARLGAAQAVVYATHLRFVTTDGEMAAFVVMGDGDEAEFAAGDIVPVLYRPGNPQAAELGTAMRVDPVAIPLGITGVLLFDFGGVLWILRRRQLHAS